MKEIFCTLWSWKLGCVSVTSSESKCWFNRPEALTNCDSAKSKPPIIAEISKTSCVSCFNKFLMTLSFCPTRLESTLDFLIKYVRTNLFRRYHLAQGPSNNLEYLELCRKFFALERKINTVNILLAKIFFIPFGVVRRILSSTVFLSLSLILPVRSALIKAKRDLRPQKCKKLR